MQAVGGGEGGAVGLSGVDGADSGVGAGGARHNNQAVVGYLRDKIRKEMALVFLDSLVIVVSTEKNPRSKLVGKFFAVC